MINHNRTLLLNLAGSDKVPNYIGEEVIDPGFTPINLGGTIKRANILLFGEDPDREMRNRLVFEHLAILEASKLSPEFDERVTYDLKLSPYSDREFYLPKVIPLGAATGKGTILNPSETPESDSRFTLGWDVLVISGNQLRISTQQSNNVVTTEGLTSSGGLVESVKLPESGYRFVANAQVGDRWKITSNSMPAKRLVRVLYQARRAGQELISEVFQRSTSLRSVDPYPGLYEIWQEDKFGLRAMGAFLSAYIHRLESLRVKNE